MKIKFNNKLKKQKIKDTCVLQDVLNRDVYFE